MKTKMIVWRNPQPAEDILQRNYHFWTQKCEEIARLYQQKNDEYDKVMEEMKRIGKQYREVIAKSQKAEIEYFQSVLKRKEILHVQ